MKTAMALIPLAEYDRLRQLEQAKRKAMNFLTTYIAAGVASKIELEELKEILDV